MSVMPRPHALESWVEYLTQQPLPVLPHSHQALRKCLADSNVGVADLADIVVRDPLMIVQVIREVNRALKGRVLGSLMDIHHCLALLGLKRCKTLFASFQSFSIDPADKSAYAFLGSLVSSLHAAEQVSAWHQYRPQANPEQVRLATLLAGVPYWCMWRFAGSEMKMIRTLQHQEMIPRPMAEQAVLGCSVEAIVLAIAARWDFPDLIMAALDTEQMPAKRVFVEAAWRGLWDKDPKLPLKDHQGRLVSTSALPVVLANWLAHCVETDWYAKRTRSVIGMIGCYLGLEYDVARQVVQHAALQVSRQVTDWGPLTPAAALIWPEQPHRRRRIRYSQLPVIVSQLQEGKKLSHVVAYPVESDTTFQNRGSAEQSASQVVPGAEGAQESQLLATGADPASSLVSKSQGAEQDVLQSAFESIEGRRVFVAYLRRLAHQLDYYSSEFEVLRELVMVLADTARLSRIWVAKVDTSRSVMSTYYGRGLEQFPEWRGLELALQPVNFFTRLLKKPQGFWLQGDLTLTELGPVPGEFRLRMNNEQGFVHSLFHHKGPFAVLYADRMPGHADPLNDADFQVFRLAAMGCTRHLLARAKRLS